MQRLVGAEIVPLYELARRIVRMDSDYRAFVSRNPDLMARCEQGYLCEVCGEEVENITDSDLYLRFVLGEIEARDLLAAPERHLRCNPTVAQFIVDDDFELVSVEGPFDKRQLDSEYVAQQEKRITRAWRRLQEVRSLNIPISEYPLPEVLERKAAEERSRS